MAITETDINIILQRRQKVSIRLDLYDTSDTKISELTGFATSLSWSISSDSDIRRTASLTMYIPDKDYLAQSHLYIWLNRKIKTYIGLNDETGTVHWYLIGSFMISDSTYTYNATTQELSLPLIDLMACTTEKRGSQINGYGLTIPSGENVRSAIISVIEGFTPFHQYSIPEFSDTIPYDLEFSIGVYPYEVLSKILSLWPTYEMYYDVDGVFTVSEIPTGVGDDVFLDETVIDALYKGETKTSSYSSVRNTTEIIGRSLDADYTATSCTTSGSTYNLEISEDFEVLEQGALYGFTPDTTSVSGQKLKIQATAEISIYLQGATAESDTLIPAGSMTSGIPYCIKYSNERFYLQGELEIHAIVQERNVALSSGDQAQFKIDKDCRDVEWVINPDSPFAADAVGEIWQVLSDGEYADIYTTQLALERGRYENWRTTRLPDSIQISCMMIPFLDVNKKISRTNPMTGDVETFLVNNASFDIKTYETSIDATTFYSYMPW